MAPRRRAAASGAPRPGLRDLDDAALLQIMAKLTLVERHEGPAQVCRRWAQLVNAPQLLADVEFSTQFAGHYDQYVQAEEFTQWLLRRAAPHVRRLRLEYGPVLTEEADMFDLDRAAVQGIYTTAALQCRSLEELSLALYGDPQWRVPAALPFALPALRRLRLAVSPVHLPEGRRLRLAVSPVHLPEGRLLLGCSLAGMTQLEELSLEGNHVDFGVRSELPPAITRLYISDSDVSLMVASLTNLRSLTLEGMYHGFEDPEDFELLARLGGTLERLELLRCESLPSASTMAALPRLQALRLWHFPDNKSAGAVLAELTASLAPLATQLTALCLGCPAAPSGNQARQWKATADSLRATLTAATNLRRLQLPLPVAPPASAVEWWGRLEQLGVSSDVLVACGPALAGASRLEWLGLGRGKAAAKRVLSALEAALRQLPRVRWLEFDQQGEWELGWAVKPDEAAKVAAKHRVSFSCSAVYRQQEVMLG